MADVRAGTRRVARPYGHGDSRLNAVSTADTAADRPGALLGRLARWTRSWSFVGALVVLYVLIGLQALRDDRYLNAEGLLTYLYAEFLRRDFVPTFFWLKSHPALALLNLPGALLGLGGFLVLHVCIGAAGVVFVAVAARRAGIREVGIAPLVLATSPLYVEGGASGIGNVDGAAIASGALALCLGAAPGFLAGLVTGTLPFIRFEVGLLTLALAVTAVAARSRGRFLPGLACAPLAYLGAGAVYHGAPLWFVDFPPAWSQWDPTSFAVVAQGVQNITVAALIRSLGLTIPALPLLLVRRSDRATRRPFDVPLVAYVIVFVAAITLLPFARVAFGFDDRYYLTALPVVALLAARAADSFGRGADGGFGRVARALVAVACAAGAAWAGAWGLAGTALAAGVIVTAGARVTAATALAAVSAAMLLTFALTLPRGYRGHTELRAATAWLRDHRAELAHVPIYTNFKLLSAFASRSGAAPGFDIAGLIQPDMRRELLEWANPANGQRQRIWRLAHEVLYGRGADPADIVEGRAPPGSLLVLKTDDIRTEAMFPRSFLAAHTRTLVDAPGLLIAVVLPQEPPPRSDEPGGAARVAARRPPRPPPTGSALPALEPPPFLRGRRPLAPPAAGSSTGG